MQTSRNISDWANRVWAAFIYFTRLPLWRLHEPPREAYNSVVENWPLTGWLTGGVMAAVLWLGSMVFPWTVAVVLAIAARMLLTGAFHEDGLADFFDGFGGGGRNRDDILRIMKDSRIGTYGVLSLVVYVLLLFMAIHSMKPFMACLAILAADPYSKMVAGQVVQMMPYARNEQTSKSHTVYRRISVAAGIGMFVEGMLPLVGFLLFANRFVTPLRWDLLIAIPCLTMFFLYLLIWHRLRGYTGDCCGAMFLLVELSFLLTVSAML